MDGFFKILLTVMQLIRAVALVFALYGLIWLPRFQNGVAKGPHWLLYLYDGGIPILLGIGVIGIIIVFIYNLLIALIPGQSPSGTSGVFRGLFLWILGIAICGGLPSFVSRFSHMQELAFNDDSYHLIERATNSDTVEYFVYRCTDPIGLWCERVTVTNDLPAPPPTPLPPPPTLTPEALIEDGSAAVQAEAEAAQPFITVTPPAELVTNEAGELLIQVGLAQAVITSTQPLTPTMTPLP